VEGTVTEVQSSRADVETHVIASGSAAKRSTDDFSDPVGSILRPAMEARAPSLDPVVAKRGRLAFSRHRRMDIGLRILGAHLSGRGPERAWDSRLPGRPAWSKISTVVAYGSLREDLHVHRLLALADRLRRPPGRQSRPLG